nr:3-oxoacyl-[acyl-carrier-protein] synthase I, chloroplastic [Tanacetum cinerariifolium]
MDSVFLPVFRAVWRMLVYQQRRLTTLMHMPLQRGAARGLEAIATVKAIQTGCLHPSINQFNPEPAVEFDTVANIKQQHENNVAVSNSFGFGEHKSVLAFSTFKP